MNQLWYFFLLTGTIPFKLCLLKSTWWLLWNWKAKNAMKTKNQITNKMESCINQMSKQSPNIGNLCINQTPVYFEHTSLLPRSFGLDKFHCIWITKGRSYMWWQKCQMSGKVKKEGLRRKSKFFNYPIK